MKDKICIITGATSGMGLATAVALAGMGATLGLVCRNREKGETVLKSIIEKTKNNKIELFIADLSSQAEIRKLAIEIKTKFPVINVLVNNAGGINHKRITTIDGFELTFAVNHLAYFLLTNLLLENLKAAPKARIISVASIASNYGKINFNDLNFEKRYDSFKVYAQSKLANIIFTYELARRLQGTNITANCLHPGMVKTRFATDMKNNYFGFFWKLINPILITAEKGAETAIWLASSPDAEGISGKYFKEKKEIKSIRSSYNPDIQKRLWEISEKFCNL
ncbi:MAG TPA: SDR family oxidoreductase [Bacteroidales bacterium]|nr:SDR family oxidoreductase [Bacteroidales bacterium]HPS17524.1 SDR family oxidoreductase [Bacteroidales bacterium]